MCRFYCDKFKRVPLELETIRGRQVDPEELRLESLHVTNFRTQLFAYVNKHLNVMTYRRAANHANELKAQPEFANIKSLRNLELSRSWWEKYAEVCQVRGEELTTLQKYELYQFTAQNPEKSFTEISKIMSEKFKASSRVF